MLNLCIVIITVLYVNAMCRDVETLRRRDRKPSRIVKKLKRLSQKSRKLRVICVELDS